MRKRYKDSVAHALILLAVCWSLFSLGAVLGSIDSIRHRGSNELLTNLLVPLVICGIHAFIIGLAIYRWDIEKTHRITPVEEPNLDKESLRILIANAKFRFKRSLVSKVIIASSLTILSLPALLFPHALQFLRLILGVALCCGGFLLLCIASDVWSYISLQWQLYRSKP